MHYRQALDIAWICRLMQCMTVSTYKKTQKQKMHYLQALDIGSIRRLMTVSTFKKNTEKKCITCRHWTGHRINMTPHAVYDSFHFKKNTKKKSITAGTRHRIDTSPHNSFQFKKQYKKKCITGRHWT